MLIVFNVFRYVCCRFFWVKYVCCRCSYVIILCVQGFDAWQCPENVTEMGLIKTLLVSKEESPDEYEKFNQLSQFALDQYNDQQVFPCVCVCV